MSTTSKTSDDSKRRPVTVPEIMEAKGRTKITCLTAYDYCTGLLADQSGTDMILVGDSVAMVSLGHENTLSVTLDEMLHHTKATARGVKNALLITDMPFMSFQVSVEDTLRNAGRLVKEGGAQAVKLEGGRNVVPQIEALVNAGIPVMGHLGLTPQSVNAFGGFKAQGKTADAVKTMLEDAHALAEAGVFSIVLEAMPEEAADLITERIPVPTIGIGAGNVTDGQVLVYHDVLGLFDRFTPKFVRRYADLGSVTVDALTQYCEEVRRGRFPAEKHTIYLAEEEKAAVAKLKKMKL